MDQVQRDVVRQGELVDVFGRRYAIDARKAYKGVNYIVQGSAAGVLKAAMLRVAKRSKNKDSHLQRIKMLSCVHDEIMFSVPFDYPKRVIGKILKDLMEDRKTFAVPITVDVAWSDTNWAEKKELKPVIF